MIFEHFALNVSDSRAVVAWYETHIGLRSRTAQAEPPYTTFLEDSSGRVMMEIYQRDDAARTDFGPQHPLTFHIAFVSEDASADQARLLAAGATYVETVSKPDGSQLVMLRDPWGLSLQLCQRAKRF